MGRDSYDDMQSPSERGRRGGGRGKVGILALFCVLVFLVFLIGYMLFVPAKESSEGTPAEVKAQSIVQSAPQKSEEVEKKSEEKADAKPEVQVVQISTEEPKSEAVPAMQTHTTSARDLVQAREESSSSRIRYTEHEVKAGEDLGSIASQYGLKVQTIISVNKIRNIAGVTEGVKLRIPDRDGQIYTVQNGDMLSTIARRFNPEMGWKQLQELNGLKTENIRVGQDLFIPDPVQAGPGVVSAAAITFIRPVSGGTVTASFGQLVDGQPLGGVYIRGSAGSAVIAASKGSVIDAGNDPEMGRFVTLQHEDGYKTTYAYLERVEVKVGMEVEAEKVIGSIGLSSGKTTEPILYFILEQSGIPLDPALFF
ncbi:MAG: peptidoglycan DD-metalloendopeptidase family protein [Spirochaetales bacterium]|nr:peptidoglycan DD-metalloendopeptidase family protein [Spirochaetales bacterium]